MSVSRKSASSFLSYLFLICCWIASTPPGTSAQHNSGIGRQLRQKVFACEGQTLKINCYSNPGERIRIVRAIYGRFSIAVCNPNGESGWSTKCVSHTSIQVLTERCSDKTNCAVEVADKTFGDDPCPETDKYLEVHYECTSDPVFTTPEPERSTLAPLLFQSRVFAVTTTQTTPPAPTTPTTTTTTTTSTTTTQSTLVMTTETPATVHSSVETYFSTDSDVGVPPVRPQPRVDAATEFCPAVWNGNVMWRPAPKGTPTFENCPGAGRTGYASWTCDRGSPPQWLGTPNFSDCKWQWMADIMTQITGGIPIGPAENFVAWTASNALNSSQDMTEAVHIVGKLLDGGFAMSRMSEGDGSSPAVKKLGELVLKAGNSLLEPKHNASWEDMDSRDRAQTATTLMSSMEATAFMLAGNSPDGEFLENNDHNVLMSTGRLMTQPLRRSYTLSDGRKGSLGNSIEFPAATLKNLSQNDQVKVVFLSYKNIGQYLAPVGGQSAGDLENYAVNSRVVTASLNSASQRFVTLKEPVRIHLDHLEGRNGRHSVCAYWDYEHNVDRRFFGRWSTDGCRVVVSEENHTECECDHLTSFAVLLDVTGTIVASVHDDPLTKITWIGCSISIVCLVVTLIVFCSFRTLQSERTTIHKNLAFCLLIAEIFFLAGIDQVQLGVGCNVFSAFMHYFFLATFMWSLFEGINLWLMLVDVFEPEKSRRLYYYIAGYGVPAVIVGICLCIDWTSYATPAYCWLRSDNYFILSFAVPVALIILANFFFLAVALYYMCRNVGLQSALHARDVSTWKHLKKWISGAFALVCVMGITWVFGFMYLGNGKTVIFAYIFTFLNSFQGVFIFVMVCLRNEKVKGSLRQFIANQAQRLSDSFCGRSPSTYSDSTPSGGGPGFYQCAPHPLDKEQQYITNYPTYWHTPGRPDMSRRSTVTSTLPPHSPAPVPHCTCEHDFPEKTSSRSSNRDSGHESASCPSAESPPMQPLNNHLHQRTLYPPSVARKHASQVLHVEHPTRHTCRSGRYLYGERPLYCGDEHIYAEIDQQQLEEEANCPYSDPSDESNTSATYQHTGSEHSSELDERCPRLVGITVDEEGRKVPVYHPSICSLGSEHKPLIHSLGRPVLDHHQRHCEVRSAFRTLANGNPHSKMRGRPANYVMKGQLPYANGDVMPTEVVCVGAGNYNAFGLTGRRDGSKMIRRIPMMPKTTNGDQPLAFSEC